MATATAAFNESLRTLTEEQDRCRCRLTEDLAAWGCCLHSKTLLPTTPQSDVRRAPKSRRASVANRTATKSGGPARRAVSCCHLLSFTGGACFGELHSKRGDRRPGRAKPTPSTSLVASRRPQKALDQRAATGVDRRREQAGWRREPQGRRRATDAEQLAALFADQLASLADRTSRWWRPQPLPSGSTRVSWGGATSASR